jgi:hypothetical protein
MDDTTAGGAAWEALRRRRRLLLAAAALGLTAGAVLAVVRPPQAVAGSEVMFADDPADPKRVDTEVRVATSHAVRERVAQAVPGRDAEALADALTATKVTHDVVRLTATANSAAAAGHLADAYTASYIDFAGGIQRQTATDEAAALNRQLDPVDAQLAAVTDRLNSVDSDPRLNATGSSGEAARLEQDTLQKSADRLGQNRTDLQAKIAAQQVAADRHDWFTPINRTAPVAASLAARAQRVLLPTVALPLLTAVGIVVARRRDLRLYHPDEVTRAVGIPVPATVVAPARLAGFVDPAAATAAEQAEELRYRRALARLLDGADGPPFGPTLVRVAGDVSAEHAAHRLADLLPADATGARHLIATDAPLPDLHPDTRPVLVVTAGTLTPDRLRALAAACREAGRAPHAVLLVTPPRVVPQTPRLRPRPRRTEPVTEATA